MSHANAACPGAYATAPCDGGGTNEVCILTSSDTMWTCSLDINGDTAAALAYVVYDTSLGYHYSAWGNTAAGTGASYDFCCQVDGLNDGTHVRTVKLAGGSGNDFLYFTYSTADLRTHSAEEGYLTGKMYGRDGDDTMSGSKEGDDDLIVEYLYGEGDNDHIVANAGDDNVDGGAGVDEIDGNNGKDQIEGGAGADFLTGGPGDDTIDGGPGADQISGGAGSDTLTGAGGDDEICGGADNDTMFGGSSDDHDEIFGDSGSDAGNAGSSLLDKCDSGPYLGCEFATLTACPF